MDGRHAWLRVVPYFASAPAGVYWGRVSGPAATTIAILFATHWRPLAPDRRGDAAGGTWMCTGGGYIVLAAALCAQAQRMCWAAASERRNGIGSGAGPMLPCLGVRSQSRRSNWKAGLWSFCAPLLRARTASDVQKILAVVVGAGVVQSHMVDVAYESSLKAEMMQLIAVLTDMWSLTPCVIEK